MATDGIGQRFQKGGGLADPVGQCRAIKIEAFAVEYLALAIECKRRLGPTFCMIC